MMSASGACSCQCAGQSNVCTHSCARALEHDRCIKCFFHEAEASPYFVVYLARTVEIEVKSLGSTSQSDNELLNILKSRVAALSMAATVETQSEKKSSCKLHLSQHVNATTKRWFDDAQIFERAFCTSNQTFSNIVLMKKLSGHATGGLPYFTALNLIDEATQGAHTEHSW